MGMWNGNSTITISVCVVGFDLCFDVPRKLAEDNFDGMCPVSSAA